jgi:hypothetical protein
MTANNPPPAPAPDGEVREAANGVVSAWEYLPGNGYYGLRVVQEWLSDRMKPAMDSLRAALATAKPETPAHGGVEAVREATIAECLAAIDALKNFEPANPKKRSRFDIYDLTRAFKAGLAMAREDIAALTPPATGDAASPAGWKLVPVEPTEEMCRAAVWALDRAREADGLLQEPRPYKGWEKHAIRYRAMLAATPAPAKAAASPQPATCGTAGSPWPEWPAPSPKVGETG